MEAKNSSMLKDRNFKSSGQKDVQTERKSSSKVAPRPYPGWNVVNGDFILQSSDGYEFFINRAKLAVISVEFSNIFNYDIYCSHTGRKIDEIVDGRLMAAMLNFAYGQKSDLNGIQFERLYYAAHIYGLKALKIQTRMQLIANLSCDSLCKLIRLAAEHNDEDLLHSTFTFIQDHSEDINMPWEDLHEISTEFEGFLRQIVRFLAERLKGSENQTETRVDQSLTDIN